MGEVLKRCGVWVLYKDICITAAFLSAAIIPLPAFRAFSFQAAIVSAFNALSMLLLFPALLGLDLRRVAANQLDLLCCYKGQNNQKSQKLEEKANSAKAKVVLDPESSKTEDGNQLSPSFYQKLSINYLVTRYWSFWVMKTPVKTVTLLVASILTCCGLYGLANMKEGLNMQEVVPSNTSAYQFIKAQNSYFGFYHMYAVTQGHFEYPQNQKTLYDYHNAFVR